MLQRSQRNAVSNALGPMSEGENGRGVNWMGKFEASSGWMLMGIALFLDKLGTVRQRSQCNAVSNALGPMSEGENRRGVNWMGKFEASSGWMLMSIALFLDKLGTALQRSQRKTVSNALGLSSDIDG